MPIDDPGWGDFTPPPAGQQPQQQPPQQPQPQQPQPQQAPQTQPQAPAPGPSGPSPFSDPKVRMVLGGLVVLALAAGAFFMFAGGDDSDDGKKPSAAAGGGDEAEVPEGGDEGEDIGTLTLQDYADVANQICSAYADDIQAASQSQDFQALAQVDQAMLDELMSIPPPDESADVVEGMYSDFQQAVDAIAAGDVQTAQQYASSSSAAASQLGLDACVAT